jgi:hypothetical protein
MKMNVTDPECRNWHAYHIVFSMKTLVLTVCTQIIVATLKALVAKPFYFLLTSIAYDTSVLVPTCETVLFLYKVYIYYMYVLYQMEGRRKKPGVLSEMYKMM